MKSVVAQLCPTLCNPMDSSPPGSSVHGTLYIRILEWVAISFSKGSSWPRDWTWVSCMADSLLSEPPGQPNLHESLFNWFSPVLNTWKVFNCQADMKPAWLHAVYIVAQGLEDSVYPQTSEMGSECFVILFPPFFCISNSLYCHCIYHLWYNSLFWLLNISFWSISLYRSVYFWLFSLDLNSKNETTGKIIRTFFMTLDICITLPSLV